MTADDELTLECGCPASGMQSHPCTDPELHHPGLPYVDAAALWWNEPEACTCTPATIAQCTHDVEGGWYPPAWPAHQNFFSFEHAGTTYILDGYLALPDHCITGLDSMDKQLEPLSAQMQAGMIEHLEGRVSGEAPARWFREPHITVLEQAGFRIRPLAGVEKIHAVCDPARPWEAIGLIASMRPDQQATALHRPAMTESL